MDIETAARNLFVNYGALTGTSEQEYRDLIADGMKECDMTAQQIYNGLRCVLGVNYGKPEYFSDREAADLLGMNQDELQTAMQEAGIVPEQTESKIYYFPNVE